jgi:hypothetical protein
LSRCLPLTLPSPLKGARVIDCRCARKIHVPRPWTLKDYGYGSSVQSLKSFALVREKVAKPDEGDACLARMFRIHLWRGLSGACGAEYLW